MQDKHHLWFRRRDYTSRLERKFRNLPCNVILIDREIHNLLHRYTEPPVKPTAKEMRRIIEKHTEKRCRCYRR